MIPPPFLGLLGLKNHQVNFMLILEVARAMNERGPNLMFLNATWQFRKPCFYTTRTEGAQRVHRLGKDERKSRDENRTYECITRADFLIFFAGGSFANRGVLALDETAAPGGGGARNGGGDEEAGVPVASSSSSCSFLDLFRLVPLRKRCSDGASGPIGEDGNAEAGCT